ncbi:MAG TPA: TonB-dependent receptor plug domain-containing protein [Balneolaceae bacterium]|nr:TonB-dependent receptor plug domain-containing protein [Balneolaceae bacterium]
MKFYILNFLIVLLSVGCATSRETSGTAKASTSEVKVDNPSTSLADYLKRVPGVEVFETGSTAQITIRGTVSVYGNPTPLFVVDGNRYGRDFSDVKNAVPVDMIKSVRVLKGVEASSAYGMEGGAGVIVIKTKNNK